MASILMPSLFLAGLSYLGLIYSIQPLAFCGLRRKLSVAMGLPLRFHWNPFGGRWPGNGALAEVCRFAEECGIESVLVNIEPTLGDPLANDPLAPFVTAGDTSRKIRFMAGFGTSS